MNVKEALAAHEEDDEPVVEPVKRKAPVRKKRPDKDQTLQRKQERRAKQAV